MKNIEPIQVWKNGASETASFLDSKITNDNLSTTCLFYWQLLKQDPVNPELPDEVSYTQLSEGHLEMTSDDYTNWDGSNDSAYVFIAQQLGLTLV